MLKPKVKSYLTKFASSNKYILGIIRIILITAVTCSNTVYSYGAEGENPYEENYIFIRGSDLKEKKIVDVLRIPYDHYHIVVEDIGLSEEDKKKIDQLRYKMNVSIEFSFWCIPVDMNDHDKTSLYVRSILLDLLLKNPPILMHKNNRDRTLNNEWRIFSERFPGAEFVTLLKDGRLMARFNEEFNHVVMLNPESNKFGSYNLVDHKLTFDHVSRLKSNGEKRVLDKGFRVKGEISDTTQKDKVFLISTYSDGIGQSDREIKQCYNVSLYPSLWGLALDQEWWDIERDEISE